MALGKRYSISTFITKFLWILFLVFQESKLVICDGLEDDSLRKALEAVERRQRDLEFQENDYYGQPENIGYGFQKTLGFFDSGPATELGSFDSAPKGSNDVENLLLNYGGYGEENEESGGFEKRKSNFRERTSSRGRNFLLDRREGGEDRSQMGGGEYLQLLKNLWSKYRESRPEDVNVEDLTEEQVGEILNSLYGRGDGEEKLETNGYDPFEVIPVRSRKNYRVFDGFGDRRKRYPSFGEGIYGKRNLRSQNINYDAPPESEFLYSLKFVNPELNREAVENLRGEGLEMLGDEKDRDVMRILNDAMTRGKYAGGEEEEEGEDQPYWLKDEEEDVWLPGPVTFSDEMYDVLGRNEKRGETAPRFFKNHNGIHLNPKRFPVKRSSVRVRKEARSFAREVKEIFATEEPKKTTTKKPTPEPLKKKQNTTKPEMTKHHENKKIVVRRAEKLTKEEVAPGKGNEEIANIFNVDKKKKKSIDWSQYFGLDKRSGEKWLKEDHLRRAEGHLMGVNVKRYPLPKYLTNSHYEMPFDTRKFNEKRRSYDVGSTIDKVENKIGDIEEKIIDDAVKYTGAHSGRGKEDLGRVKTKVIQHLEAAYNLEKMKNALEEFKNLIKPHTDGRSLKKTATEAPKAEVRTTVPKESSNLEKPLSDKTVVKENKKRVATKKEGVEEIFREDPGAEFLNDMYGSKQSDNEGCPVLDKILHNCLRVEEIGGRYSELLLPLCSLQQICYFCAGEIGFSKMAMCDAMYLTEAQNICQGDSDCLVNARNSMLALQDLYEQDLASESGRRLLSGSCSANPCIQRYFLTAPGAIYPLEIQK